MAKSTKKSKVLRATVADEITTQHMTSAGRPLRVMVIQPPAQNGVRSLFLQVDDDGGEGIGFKPPLGVLYIATIVKERSPHEVKVVDAIAERLSYEDVVEIAKDYQPDVIGISVWTDFWYCAYHLGDLLKGSLPDAHLTMGGPHLGIYPQETLDVPFVDSVIVGDGEIPFLYLCNMLSNDNVDNSFPGLHIKNGGVKEGAEKFYIQSELDSLPFPDRTLLTLNNYTSVIGKNEFVTTMITSRGCPYSCTFCKLNFQKTLAHSAEYMIEEFRAIKQLGIKEVEIYDDTFTWSKKRLIEFCERLVKEDFGITWAIRDRVSSKSIEPDILNLMYRAGCRRIHYGVESGVQKVIDRMQKKVTLEQAERAVKLAKKAGMTVLTYFMIGNLDETEEDMRASIDFAIKLNADYSTFSITIPYAGTDMYKDALAEGLIEEDYWGRYARMPEPDFAVPQIIEQHVSMDKLLEIRNEAVRRYYFRPKYILHETLKLRSPGELSRKAKMAYQLYFGSA